MILKQSTNHMQMTGKDKCYIDVISDMAGMVSIKDQWEKLQHRCEIDIPFNNYDWYHTWWVNFRPSNNFSIIVVYKDSLRDQIYAIFPTYRTDLTKAGEELLNSWSNTHSYRTGLLCDQEHLDALGCLVTYMFTESSWNVLKIPYLVKDSETYRKFKEILHTKGIKYIAKQGKNSPFLKVHGTWDDFFGQLGRSRRESLRRKSRKLLDKSQGRVEIHFGKIDGNNAKLEEKLKDCWLVSMKTWKHTAGSSIAADPQRLAFYEELAKKGNGWIVLALLYKENTPIAFEYNLLYRETLYNLKLGYDEDYRKYSPGIVLRLKMLEWVFNKPDIKYFDYMGNAADYKTMFSTNEFPHEDIEIYYPTFKNSMVVYYRGTLRPILASYLRPVKNTLKSTFIWQFIQSKQ